MSALDVFALALALPIATLLAIFSAETLAGLRPLACPGQEGLTPSTIVLIPAHDESAGIVATVMSARMSGDPRISILVVADNCSDDTAGLARGAGAQVVERSDATRRGKGYALAFGRDMIAQGTPPECVIVLDADCVVEGRGAPALAYAAVVADRAMQARNLQRPDHTAPTSAQISNFAFLVKNLVRQRGMARLGGVAALTGTGMALPWRQFARAPLASEDLAEDLALGTWLTLSGDPPSFHEAVHVWSKAEAGSSLLVQRQRWEGGFLAIARRQALALMGAGVFRASRSKLWLGLHLIVPPLALLFAGASASVAVTAVLAVFGASIVPTVLIGGAMLIAAAATTAAWSTEGRNWIAGKVLLRVPLYIIAKLSLYRSLLGRGTSRTWIRTKRPSDNKPR